MREPRQDLDLAPEPLGTDCPCEVGVQYFDGDAPSVLQIGREVDGGHAAAAELALDSIAAGKGLAQRFGNDGCPRFVQQLVLPRAGVPVGAAPLGMPETVWALTGAQTCACSRLRGSASETAV